MAVRPIDLYGGQIDNTDPAYPHGKAKNVTVAGDGSGTPLEKEWLNDLWGFLQALLYDGGVTPSGVADKVGASQYLTAVKNVFNARVTTLLGSANWWAAEQTFGDTIRALTGIDLIGTLSIIAPPTLTYVIPLRLAQPGLLNDGMQFYASGDRIYCNGDGANTLLVRFPILFPNGAIVSDAWVTVKPNASPVTTRIMRMTPDYIVPITVPVPEELPLSFAATLAGGAAANTINNTLVAPVTLNNLDSEYWVEVDVGNSDASAAEIYACRVSVQIPRLTPM